MIHLVLGGARSGKSSYAERTLLAEPNSQGKLHYIATAIAFDQEMEHRIEMHRQQRGDKWHLYECPQQLPELLSTFKEGDHVLVDCLTLWLNNVIYQLGENCPSEHISRRVDELVNQLRLCAADVTLVSNEVGLGIIPLGKVTRVFVDHAGWMNQKLAAVADKVTFVAAGLPMTMKESCDAN
ncbi:bifunctional adenosylcobinamide kinase/adenosylcobinamide-phosphate guanylyltransferase [Vibrio sp. SCSIO 43136]|uniref:bifunctional adenosylcobinamide kinase/adenosylcobinamide-phosphate guanylyltransferase n=1 Tax=Vibrio sp. SCSIO 43136 TaxID=2819101 RepID=UPI002074BF9B|nr:bifunctional adenosylcobinamide kinase/adenosylcobinamide-phosphate guanylyltransferase [Vibrio sp. SCSIO 43136]USD63985.1 bifunctional adenosylcobinamide kinase/adenosylcobinamide-phosphate guanylyltransferase [Vibrio sp. SCSIO 43136]